MAAGLSEHRWTKYELLADQVPPPPWVPAKRPVQRAVPRKEVAEGRKLWSYMPTSEGLLYIRRLCKRQCRRSGRHVFGLMPQAYLVAVWKHP